MDWVLILVQLFLTLVLSAIFHSWIFHSNIRNFKKRNFNKKKKVLTKKKEILIAQNQTQTSTNIPLNFQGNNDLTLVKGIGQVTARKLKENKIDSITTLASLDTNDSIFWSRKLQSMKE